MTIGSILVVGSLHFDIVIDAPHLPRPDETVIGEPAQFVCGGKGGNQAVAASQHGASVLFAGALGKDFFAETLVGNLKDHGVDIQRLQYYSDTASGMSVAIVEQTGDYGAVVSSGANQRIDVGRIDIPGDVKCVILQNEVPESANIHVAKSARSIGAAVVLNAAPMRRLSPELLQNTDILIVNRVEAESLFGQPVSCKADVAGMLESGNMPVPTMIVTLGGEGLVFRIDDQPCAILPAYQVDSVSSHGAGDCFVGAFCSELAKGNSIACSLDYANAAAALYVSTGLSGRAAINRSKVNQFRQTARLVDEP